MSHRVAHNRRRTLYLPRVRHRGIAFGTPAIRSHTLHWERCLVNRNASPPPWLQRYGFPILREEVKGNEGKGKWVKGQGEERRKESLTKSRNQSNQDKGGKYTNSTEIWKIAQNLHSYQIPRKARDIDVPINFYIRVSKVMVDYQITVYRKTKSCLHLPRPYFFLSFWLGRLSSTEIG